jgi:hypothetical protein
MNLPWRARVSSSIDRAGSGQPLFELAESSGPA